MRFEKVSFEEYAKQYDEGFGDELEDIRKEYDAIKLPCRATTGSAGHDFFAPFPFKLSTDPTTGFPKEIKFGTGIKVMLDSDKVLMCYPRSGLGFKYKLQLYNTVGIIDSDYINSKNEGHIFVKLILDTDELVTLTVNEGEGFMQGIVTQFFAIDEEEVVQERDGGFGSTSKYNTGGYVVPSAYSSIGESTTNYCVSPSFATEAKGNWLSPSEIATIQKSLDAVGNSNFFENLDEQIRKRYSVNIDQSYAYNKKGKT